MGVVRSALLRSLQLLKASCPSLAAGALRAGPRRVSRGWFVAVPGYWLRRFVLTRVSAVCLVHGVRGFGFSAAMFRLRGPCDRAGWHGLGLR